MIEFTHSHECVKCGGKDVGLNYVHAHFMQEYPGGKIESVMVTRTPDYHTVICKTCGFSWNMKPRDAA